MSNFSYLQAFECVGDYIHELPFPKHLRRLTIKITRDLWAQDVALCPTLSDYEKLNQVLSELLAQGTLQHLDLTFVSLVERHPSLLPEGAAEIVKLEKVFGELLELGGLSTVITIGLCFGEVLTQWSVDKRN